MRLQPVFRFKSSILSLRGFATESPKGAERATSRFGWKEGLLAGALVGGAAGWMLPSLLRGGSNNPEVPGEKLSVKKRVMDTSSDMMQHFAPIQSIHAHLQGFHCYSTELARHVESHHFCSHLNDDVHQCVIYDSDKANARLIGIEYIITGKTFEGLPEEEKKYWHSHVYEVKSGVLTAPGIPKTAETSLMKDYVDSYGKTIHLWQVDRGDELPYGPPQVMMSYTADGQLPQALILDRDKRYGSDTKALREERVTSLPTPKILQGADSAWHGEAVKLQPSIVKPSASPAAGKSEKPVNK